MSAAALARCRTPRPLRVLAGEGLGTVWRVRYAASAPVDERALRGAIEARLAAIVEQMSQWAPGSVLSRYNASPGGSWTVLPGDFAVVMHAALGLAVQTAGAFDPTWGRTAALLGFGATPAAVPPSAEERDAATAASGWRKLRFDPATARLLQPGGLWLDLSGIAKGFAVDALANLLRDRGIDDALVEIGGELVGRGLRPDGKPWWVDLEAPPGSAAAPLRLGLHEAAVATSGDYVRGAHTIDPATGRPTCDIAACSVVHRSAMLADGWATALTVLGVEAGIVLAEKEGIAARMVTQSGDEYLSGKMRAMLD